MAASVIAFAFFCFSFDGVAEPIPLRGGRVAMEFELAARELRRADEEIKAAAWDEENSGRTPAVDAALGELARASRNVAQVTAKVVSEVDAQPKKKPHVLQVKPQNNKPADMPSHSALDAERYQATNAAVMHQHQQNSAHHALASSTDAAVQAIAQHSKEQKIAKATVVSTDAAMQAIAQHSLERKRRKAMNSAADAAVDAIKRHTAERNMRDDIHLATETMVHGVAQNSHERAVADATAAAADLVRQHLEQQQQEELAEEKEEDDDEDTFQDLAKDA